MPDNSCQEILLSVTKQSRSGSLEKLRSATTDLRLCKQNERRSWRLRKDMASLSSSTQRKWITERRSGGGGKKKERKEKVGREGIDFSYLTWCSATELLRLLFILGFETYSPKNLTVLDPCCIWEGVISKKGPVVQGFWRLDELGTLSLERSND